MAAGVHRGCLCPASPANKHQAHLVTVQRQQTCASHQRPDAAHVATALVSNVAALVSSTLLLDQFGAKTTVLCVSNRPGFLQLIKLGNFVCNTKADDVSQFITRM